MIEDYPDRRPRKAPTLNDVAARAGVSTMTVSRVVNGETGVRPELRLRVEAAVAATGYAPNRAARALVMGHDLRIGLLYSNPSFAYLNEFLVGSLDEAAKSNAQIIVQPCDIESAAATAIEKLVKSRVAGVVLTPPIGESIPVLEMLRRHQLPVVSVASARAPEWAFSVAIDDRSAAYDMSCHLIRLGHRRIGFIAGDPNHSSSEQRLEGYKAALRDAGLPVAKELVAGGLFTYRSGLDAAELLLDLDERPTAIFASNDDMAAGCVAIAHQRGFDVPNDLTICGFDDTALATTIWPELTTIRQPIFDMSRAAVRLLIKAIRLGSKNGLAKQERHLQFDYQILRRQSDGPPRKRPDAHFPVARSTMISLPLEKGSTAERPVRGGLIDEL